jgi:hypothetical protein
MKDLSIVVINIFILLLEKGRKYRLAEVEGVELPIFMSILKKGDNNERIFACPRLPPLQTSRVHARVAHKSAQYCAEESQEGYGERRAAL